jgi:hypothetical protein
MMTTLTARRVAVIVVALTLLVAAMAPLALAAQNYFAASNSASVKVPLTELQSRGLLDTWAGQGQLGIVPVPPGVRGPLSATASGGGLSLDTSIALMIGTAVIAALLIGAIPLVGSARKQQQPECVGEGCSDMT